MENRHQFRASWHDYNEGLFFVTICANERCCLFGKILHGTMHLSEIGKMADCLIAEMPQHYKQVSVLNSVVMPNHIHMMVKIWQNEFPVSDNIGCLRMSSHTNLKPDFHHNSILGRIIGSYKSSVTRLCRQNHYDFGECLWQERFHEHIVRKQDEYEKIMNYINQNISNWRKDCFYQT